MDAYINIGVASVIIWELCVCVFLSEWGMYLHIFTLKLLEYLMFLLINGYCICIFVTII